MTITIFTRAECHLCELMLAELQALQNQYDFAIEIVDVGHSLSLQQNYGDLVPLLLAEGKTLCYYHFDAVAVQQFFQSRQ
jgi:hypothetical protein